MNKFLIIDDHYIFRQGVKKVLSEAFKQVQFGEADNSSTALMKIYNSEWDLVITDLNMPGRSGWI